MDPSKPIPLAERLKSSEGEIIPTKRTFAERSSSSYDGPIVASEDYRAGFPDLPELPMEMEFPSADEERVNTWGRCSSKAASILEEAGLVFDNVHVDMTRGRRGAVFHPTILISVPDSADRDLWQPTLISIGKMLDQERALEMHVLITEPRGRQWNHAYTFEADHPIVKLWPEKLVGPVLEALDSIEFENLCVWKWGVTEEAAELTVLIVVEDKQKRQCDHLIEDIARVCADGGAPYLKVAITEGRNFQSTSLLRELEQGRIQGRRSYQQKIAMGHSISAEPKSGGTLGGYLQLVDPKNIGKPVTIFITNWHVLRPSDPKLSADYDDGPKKYGQWIQHTSSSVQSPATADMESRIKQLRNSLSILKTAKRLTFLQNKANDNTASISEGRQLAAKREAIQESVRELREYIYIIGNKARLRFGEAKMASGYGKMGGVALDWAIGEPDVDRIGGNLLPSQADLERMTGDRRYNLLGAEYVPGIDLQPLSEGRDVFKVGRTTGLTVGKVHVLKSTSSISIQRPSNSKYDKPRRTTFEHQVIKADYSLSFNAPGDSGSWILDDSGYLVGLLWGGNDGDFSCYFTPIKEVIEDIEEKTKRDVKMYLPS